MKVKTCRDCKWSTPEPGFEWNLFCTNPAVNRYEPYFLSGAQRAGSSCREERSKRFLTGACGMRGAKFEARADVAVKEAA